jgi:ATP-dependent 26S proteasome regulatory subunit
MHGPPGNGKTSMIRFIGGALPSVPAMILRPEASFDDDDMKQIVRRWSEQAPAILVIEDLDWLLDKRVNVSIFLNLIDGIDASVTGGLLLIATTNHPETLDPAINNRPGRFDVVIEVDVPTPELRGRFLRDKLEDASMAEAILDRLVDRTDGLSFAHLQEILRLSGMLAIRDGRSQRSDEDLLRAADLAVEGHEAAIRGYPPGRPVMPFGLAQLRKSRPCTD